MKFNVIVALAITAALGSNAYALQISKGRLISHKEWATGGAVVKLVSGQRTKQDVLKSKSTLRKGGFVSSIISVRTEPVNAAIAQVASVQNNSYILINNETETTQQYDVNLNICVDLHNNMAECVFSHDVYELEPGGDLFESKMPTLDLTFAEPGTYAVNASGMYEGEGSAVRSMSSSSANIIVS